MRTKSLVTPAWMAVSLLWILPAAKADEPYTWYTNPANGHRYALTHAWGTWTQCEAEAVVAGGHLVTVNDEAEKNWLIRPDLPFGSSYARNYPGDPSENGVWVGLRYHGGDIHTQEAWEWVNGEPIGYWVVQPSFYEYDGIHMAMTGTYHNIGAGEFANGPHTDLDPAYHLKGVIEVVPPPSGGSLLVSSHLTNEVREYDLDTGSYLRSIGGSDHLNGPIGLVISPYSGNLLVASEITETVEEFDLETGQWVRQFASGGLSRPAGMLFGPNGNLLVASRFNNQVVEFDGVTGQFVRVFATANPLDGPADFAISPYTGHLLVSSRYSDTVLTYDGFTSNFLGVFCQDGGMDYPVGMAFGPDKNLYVANRDADSVLQFNGATGSFIMAFAAGVEIDAANTVVFTADGRMLVGANITKKVAAYDGQTGAYLGVLVDDPGLDYPAGLLVLPAVPVQLISAKSRKEHPPTGGITGNVDLLAGGVECRMGGLSTLILGFDRAVRSTGFADIGCGNLILSRGTCTSVTGSGTETLTVEITDEPSDGCITIGIQNIQALDGGSFDGPTEIHVRTLVGDRNGDGVVNIVDLNEVKKSLFQATPDTFRSDMNVDGVINITDLNEVKKNLFSQAACE